MRRCLFYWIIKATMEFNFLFEWKTTCIQICRMQSARKIAAKNGNIGWYRMRICLMKIQFVPKVAMEVIVAMA